MYYLGIDIGSTTLKLALKSVSGELVFSDYQRHHANIRLTASSVLSKIYNKFGNIPLKIAITGSVGMGYAQKANLKFVQEVVASAAYINHEFPQVRTFVDMGGEDSKMIFFEKGRVPDMRMNGSCAGGTGAFIDQTVSLLKIDNTALNTLAEKSTQIYPIASRCGVYSKTDIQNLIARGVGKSDIVVSTFRALAQQVLSSLARGVDIASPVLFCGGPFAFLPELLNQFCEVMHLDSQKDVVIPPHPELIPALGCCSLAEESAVVELRKLVALSRFTKEETKDTLLYKDRLPALFDNKDAFNHWKSSRRSYQVPQTELDKLDNNMSYFLGVDSGSTTTKIVLLDAQKRLVYSDYRRNEGDSFGAFYQGMQQLYEACGDIQIQKSCITGYGENLLKTAFSLNEGIVETIAHSIAAKSVLPNVSFVLDIGGQDMKAIFIHNGIVTRIEINEACSSGCGSFLETFANMLNYPISEFAELACQASHPCDLGTRCTVFMNSKVKQAMREGAAVEDIAAGFSYSVIKNCLYKVLKIKHVKELGSAIVVQGGTFKNKSVVRALELLTGCEVRYTDIPELMGAYGAALHAADSLTQKDKASPGQSLSAILALQNYTSQVETCSGCENHCLVKAFKFANGRTFYSGNNCEKVYANVQERMAPGHNMVAEKYRLLFSKKSPIYPEFKIHKKTKIGIPRALGIYENFPFWNTLFSCLGFEVVLSSPSTNKLVEKGSGSIMADNICFPAKVMHGHIYNLAERKVDRIFYPYVVYETQEDENASGSFNCPVVAGYSDVIRSAINPMKRFKIPFDSPIVSFNNSKLLEKSCVEYLAGLGISQKEALDAVSLAQSVQLDYLNRLEIRANEILTRAVDSQSMLIVLAGRPYHSDPLIEHKISNMISQMGVDVITENVAMHSGKEVYQSLNAISQWSYPNRVLKAAYLTSKMGNNIHFVELNSFGCGPDAFILDEVSTVLERGGKFPTILKIDDVNNIGSLHLRIRSLVENYKIELQKSRIEASFTPKAFKTTARYEKKDKKRKIIAPYFADGYSEFIPALFAVAGYDVDSLPEGNQKDVEEGLRYANNDICYPATIVVGSIMRALKSGKYDLDNTAVIITQTGGQCRASNYIALLKNALVSEGMTHVPVLSLALAKDIQQDQPGFTFPWMKVHKIILNTILFADCLLKMYYATVSRSGGRIEACNAVKDRYTQLASQAIIRNDSKTLMNLIARAADDYKALISDYSMIPKVGIVGEIYVKYNAFSHKRVIEWLVSENVEVVPTCIYNFLTSSLVNAHVNREFFIQEGSIPLWLSDLFYKYIHKTVKKYDKICAVHPYYIPFSDIFNDMENARRIVSPAANFGEGWLIPAEICNMANHGIQNIISLQPFGCIANHLISKGIEKRVKDIYPQMSLLFLDFDASTSEANVYNRLHFMMNNARQQCDDIK